MTFYTWLELEFFGFGDVLPIKNASLRHKKLDVLQQCDSRQGIDTLGIIHDRTGPQSVNAQTPYSIGVPLFSVQ